MGNPKRKIKTEKPLTWENINLLNRHRKGYKQTD